ncbi:lytic transglycosylase domain-containing protein [Fusobacterium gastrosuis]|uniref:lytic transglycosylase domain-containing protein n=1 Tax=Fusobacterium gastrosuis TaxID=1755100 RepID=UPI002972D81D|nr:lytic transglycosylase domain-containing protein [Fusobacteriaceae bacterium]MDY5714278.1 lytic transglycosylase domain-containing protein [Fusobacterium gastrosuis]
MKERIFIFFSFIVLQSSLLANINENELEVLRETIKDVVESEKSEKVIDENSIKFSLIRSNKKNEVEKKEEATEEEITLKTLQAEIKELKEILKNNLETESEIENYIPAEDYLDFDDKEEKIAISNYIEYINNYTDDYDLAREINKNLMIYTKTYGVSPELVLSIIKIESGFNPTAESEKGAYGLMQLTRDTASYLKVDRKTIGENIKGGIKLLRELLDENNNDLVLTLASYNAGLGAVKKYGGVPPYIETKNYVERVMQGMSNISRNEIIIDSIDFDKKENF